MKTKLGLCPLESKAWPSCPASLGTSQRGGSEWQGEACLNIIKTQSLFLTA